MTSKNPKVQKNKILRWRQVKIGSSQDEIKGLRLTNTPDGVVICLIVVVGVAVVLVGVPSSLCIIAVCSTRPVIVRRKYSPLLIATHFGWMNRL